MNVVRFVLPSTLPENNRAMPPVPMVMVGVGEPLTMMFPSVLVPAMALRPAFKVTAVEVALVVLMLSLKVRSPVAVSIKTSPDDQIPVGLTEPMVTALLSRYEIEAALADDVPAAIVLTLLEVFVSVNDPVPIMARPLPVIAADCVTAPVAFSDTSLDAAVTAALIAMARACTVIGPLMDATVATVTSAALPDLPSVKPVRSVPNVNPVVDHAGEKLADAGSIVSVPAPPKPLELVDGALFRSTNAPPLMVVAPLYVPFEVSVSVLLPDLATAPVPEITPAKVIASLRLKVSVALFVTLPTISPDVEPAPTLNVPALIVVPPK